MADGGCSFGNALVLNLRGRGGNPVPSPRPRIPAPEKYLACWRRLCLWCPEVYFWYGARCLGSRKVGRIWLKARRLREQTIGELLHIGVVVLEGVVVALALDGNSVFSAGKFIL